MAVEENLIDVDFDVVDIKKKDDHPIVQQLEAFEQSDAKRSQLILVRLWQFLFVQANHN